MLTTNFGGGPDEDAIAWAVAVQADGKIIAAGVEDFTGSSGPIILKFPLARYNPDGSLDPIFGAGGKVIGGNNGSGQAALALQPDGKILVAGSSASDFALERYSPDGDTTFGTGGRATTDFKRQ